MSMQKNEKKKKKKKNIWSLLVKRTKREEPRRNSGPVDIFNNMHTGASHPKPPASALQKKRKYKPHADKPNITGLEAPGNVSGVLFILLDRQRFFLCACMPYIILLVHSLGWWGQKKIGYLMGTDKHMIDKYGRPSL